jgi:P pilus assembly chaperone PapD
MFMKHLSKLVLIISIAFFTHYSFAQSASVTPSRLYYKVAPGGYKSQKIRVTNNGKTAETFKVEFADFSAPGKKGKTLVTPAGETNPRGCSQWLSASPAFVEIAPGETKDIQLLLQVPNIPEANNARWAVAVVKLTKENKGGGDGGSDVVGMRILQSFQFVIHIFQTPPSVTFKEAIIQKFYRDSLSTDSVVTLKMEVKNTGEAIVDCAPYLDIVNSKTGEKITIKNKGFTVLPGGERELVFKLPKKLAKGTYDVLGVVDYGSDSDIAGAELKLQIE